MKHWTKLRSYAFLGKYCFNRKVVLRGGGACTNLRRSLCYVGGTVEIKGSISVFYMIRHHRQHPALDVQDIVVDISLALHPCSLRRKAQTQSIALATPYGSAGVQAL